VAFVTRSVRALSRCLIRHEQLGILRVIDMSEKALTGRTGGWHAAGGSNLELFAADALAVGTEQVQEGAYDILWRGE